MRFEIGRERATAAGSAKSSSATFARDCLLGVAGQLRQEGRQAARTEVEEPRPYRLDGDTCHLVIRRPDLALELGDPVFAQGLRRCRDVLVANAVGESQDRQRGALDDCGYGPSVAEAAARFLLAKTTAELDDVDRDSLTAFLRDAARGELPAETLTETISKLARRVEHGEDINALRVLLNEKINAFALRVQAAREQERRGPGDGARAA
jgi:hypothetical protein